MFECTAGGPPDAFVLGAGFSRALSAAMPLTDELGTGVSGRLGLTLSFADGQFEQWLSRIAEDQPDLDYVENRKNLAIFAQASETVAEILTQASREAEQEALQTPWLATLLTVLHLQQTPVITFNQDTLVEAAIDHAGLHAWGPQPFTPGSRFFGGITSNDILDGIPRLPGSRYEGYILRTFPLFKLHGSTNWYWRQGDDSGATLFRWFRPGANPENPPDDDTERQRNLPSLVPFIVPPVALKSGYYQTPLLGHLWRQARRALSDAASVTLIGYSLPVADLVVTGMLRETIVRARDSARVTIVNPHPDRVRDAVKHLGVPTDSIVEFLSLPEFVRAYVRSKAEAVVTALRAHLQGSLTLGDDILLGCTYVQFENPIETRSVGDDLELILKNLDSRGGVSNVVPSGSPTSLSGVDLASMIQDERHKRLVGVFEDGRRELVVGATPWRMHEQLVPEFQVLVTAPSF